ncbi:MAG: Smr/MutS family protein [Pseudolabrys sp.]
MSPPRRRPLSEEERVLWTTFTKAIEPLHGRPAGSDAETDPGAAEPPERLRRGKAPAAPPKSEPKPAPKAPLPLAPLDRRTKQRVARGKASIDGRLDLHGLTQDEAHGALGRFLRAATAREARLVLVITGKSGVLRRQVPQWLGLAEFRGLIIGFESAAKQHGGEGALYVRVRRVR